jgi:hypothetical protein
VAVSILLRTYWKDGIVFSADRNATVAFETGRGPLKDVEVGRFTKVLTWPGKRALIGFVGVGQLAGLRIDEWMRQFIAKTRDFERIATGADELRDLIQEDRDNDYPIGANVQHKGFIVHLGGFRRHEGTLVPVNHVVTNTPGIPGLQSGVYPDATRDFSMTD